MSKNTIALKGAGLLVALLTFTACGPSQKDYDAMKTQVQQMGTISAEKDSLLNEVALNAKLMSDISTELAKVKEAKKQGTAESPALQTTLNDRQYMLTRIQDMTTRLNQTESRLAASQKRVKSLSGESDSLKASIAAYETAVAEFQATIESQRETIAALTEQVNALTAENTQLAADKASLTMSVDSLTTRDNTAYYVIGTKQELLAKGLVVEEGKKFLFFGKKVLTPARSLNASDFTAIDLRQVSAIGLPDSLAKYQILSRQNVEALTTPPDEDGKITGTVEIGTPDQFWAPSKYLIIVQS
jgi:myosin heavy subunit